MAQRAAVNLSDLPEGDHLVKDGSCNGTCVVYMKLTEACVKAIDTLLAKKVKCDELFVRLYGYLFGVFSWENSREFDCRNNNYTLVDL